MSNHTLARTVYQPNAAHWPDGLASFEAFATIREGRRHYPEILEDQWVAVPESDIEDPTVFEDEAVDSDMPDATPTMSRTERWLCIEWVDVAPDKS